MAVAAHGFCKPGDWRHQRVPVGKSAEPDAVRMHLPARILRRWASPIDLMIGTEHGAVKPEIYFRDARDGLEPALVSRIVATESANIIERARARVWRRICR